MLKIIKVISDISKNRSVKWALSIVAIWLIVSIFCPLISNSEDYGFSIFSYAPGGLDFSASLKPPLSEGKNGIHLLGTDKIGRDVFAGMIHGARVSAVVSFFTIGIALLLGLVVGIFIGYFGDKFWKKNVIQIINLLLGLFLIGYYILHIISNGVNAFNLFPLLGISLFTYCLDIFSARFKLKKYTVPIDLIMQRFFEIKESIPGLFLILSIVAIAAQPSYLIIIGILAFLYWVMFARHARTETLRIKEEDFIKSAQASGISLSAIFYRHIMPNVMPPIIVITAFAFSSVILLESLLSFLGIGIPVEQVSWGKMLSEARLFPKAWWLALFPGLAIFLIIYAFNIIGDALSTYHKTRG